MSDPSAPGSVSAVIRTNASTLGLDDTSSSYTPVPKTWCRLRISIMRRVQCRNEPGLRVCDSTFSAW
jgi:hypothetical protein